MTYKTSHKSVIIFPFFKLSDILYLTIFQKFVISIIIKSFSFNYKLRKMGQINKRKIQLKVASILKLSSQTTEEFIENLNQTGMDKLLKFKNYSLKNKEK